MPLHVQTEVLNMLKGYEYKSMLSNHLQRGDSFCDHLFVFLGPGLQSFLKVKVALIFREIILHHDK